MTDPAPPHPRDPDAPNAPVRALPTSRWRDPALARARDDRERAPAGRGAADRVRRAHAQARPTVRLALVFDVAAALAAAQGSPRWFWLHLFLAGGIVLAISGVSLMLTVTWSAAPAPPDRWVAAQRVSIAVGAAGVAFGREGDAPAAGVGAFGALHLVGLVLLAGLLLVTARRGVERRFDVAVAAYLAALVAGIVGVSLGIAMAVDGPVAGTRAAHLTANLLGLVGLVVGGTMPFFAATVGRARLSPDASPRRLAATLAWQVGALVTAVVGLAIDASIVAALGFVAYAGGIVATLTTLPRFTRRQLEWAGPRLLGLWAGASWWVVAVVATAVDVAGDRPPLAGRWLTVLVVAGYAQILWGSLAYLLPVLRGGGHVRLGEGFATTRSWVGLAAANLAGLTAALALPGPAIAVPVAVWVVDSAWRAARVGTRRLPQPAG